MPRDLNVSSRIVYLPNQYQFYADILTEHKLTMDFAGVYDEYGMWKTIKWHWFNFRIKIQI